MSTSSLNSLAKFDASQPLLHQRGYEIQPYSSLINLPIALNVEARSEGCTQGGRRSARDAVTPAGIP
ncbi:hypothetical protein [Pantanalinema sp. GBBB05]|uniref:hypothetical protein n=1 Tax=Pantanalinema sp. GBBB05 TaxID=2604139 RepID=UPI003D8187A7